MNKNEMKFLTGLKKDFKREGYYYYKIPDTISTDRFNIAKPHDCFIGIGSIRGAMEAKYLDSAKAVSINLNDLRACQHDGLEYMIETGGLSWVFYQIKCSDGLRFYCWEYQDFVQLCENYHSNKARTVPISALNHRPYALGTVNRFGALEYDLTIFRDYWHRVLRRLL